MRRRHQITADYIYSSSSYRANAHAKLLPELSHAHRVTSGIPVIYVVDDQALHRILLTEGKE